MSVRKPRTVDIAVVDDHPLIRDGFKQRLEDISFVRRINLYANSSQLYADIADGPVGAVLLDIELKGESGLDVCRHLKQTYPGMHVIIVSSHEESRYILQAERNGASGYIFKGMEDVDFESTLQQIIFNGERIFALNHEAITDVELIELRPVNEFGQSLTRREVEIIELICRGYSSRAIAKRLQLSEATITTHRQNIRQKIGARNVVDLISFAKKQGIISSSEL